MNKVVPAAWETVCIAAALVLVVAVVRFFHLNAFNPLLVGIPIYLALLFLVVRLARSIPLPVGTVSWWRLGLVLGGIIGLYMIALNLLDALAPIHGPQNSHGDNVGPVWLLTLPLLAGV